MDYQWTHRTLEVVRGVIGISVGVTCYWPAGLPHTSGQEVMVHTGKLEVHKLGSC